ncbi:hypothetical protein BJ165DRAFT_1533304 [Panaeolus papilionaceus]|nr:hypothetical protein BJ165DRAFT_1533304 [Panaeolus papilionaceus]
MAPTKTALRTNLAKGCAVLSDKKNIMELDLSIESLKNQLHDALKHVKELEADIDEKNQALAKFSKQVQKLKDSKVQLQNDLNSWKTKHENVYHKYRMASQSTRRGLKKQNDLEVQIKLLEGVAKRNRNLLVNSARDFQQAITVLKTTNQNLQSQLSRSLTKWTENINSLKQDLSKKARALRETRKDYTKLTKQSSRAATMHTRNTAMVKAKVTSQMSKHHLMKKGIFTEETRNVVRLLVKAGCSAQYINEVLASVLCSAGIQLVDSISCTSVARIVQEGFIAAQIQLGHEMRMTQGMTFSADGTGHRSINYNSRHIHLCVEDYSSVDSGGLEPQPGMERATRFLGIC